LGNLIKVILWKARILVIDDDAVACEFFTGGSSAAMVMKVIAIRQLWKHLSKTSPSMTC